MAEFHISKRSKSENKKQTKNAGQEEIGWNLRCDTEPCSLISAPTYVCINKKREERKQKKQEEERKGRTMGGEEGGLLRKEGREERAGEKGKGGAGKERKSRR